MSLEDYLKTIDFKKLKEQKLDLLEVITKLEREKLTKKAESLQGILNLIDSIQDKAVDEYGYDEKEVFNLTEE